MLHAVSGVAAVADAGRVLLLLLLSLMLLLLFLLMLLLCCCCLFLMLRFFVVLTSNTDADILNRCGSMLPARGVVFQSTPRQEPLSEDLSVREG